MRKILTLFTLFALLSTIHVFSQEKQYQLSSHILDINTGYPAKDVKISLSKMDNENQWTVIDEKITDTNGRVKDFLPQNLTFVDKANRCDILKDMGTKIVLTTSGMGSYGPAQLYIPEYLQRRNALIHFTGYTAEGTLGARLKNANKGEAVEVGGMLVIKRADVEYTTEYSAHAKADKVISFLKQPQNLKLVLFQHGAIQIKLDFAKRVLNEVDVKQVGILGRDYFFRVNPYGLVKSLSTKFE